MFKHFVEGVKQLMVSVLTIPNGFPAARVNAQLELYQHSFHETILCLLGTPHCFSHLSLLSLTHHSVFSLYI